MPKRPSALSKLNERDDFSQHNNGVQVHPQNYAYTNTHDNTSNVEIPVQISARPRRSKPEKAMELGKRRSFEAKTDFSASIPINFAAPPKDRKKALKNFARRKNGRGINYITTEESSHLPQNNETTFAEDTFDYNDFEKQLDADDIIRARKRIRREKRMRYIHRTVTFLLVTGCLYLIFLIYGAWNTQYVYNENGMVVPQVLTAKQIGKLAEFNSIANIYRQARMVYEDVLLLDYRIAAGMEDTLLIAPEYEKELEIIEQLAIQCQGMDVQAEYAQIHTMLTAWVANDIAIYCQRMSSAIAQNNSTYAQQALEYKQICYNDFSLITENLSTIGETIYGAEIEDIIDWSPENYINETIGTIGGEVIG